MSFYRCFLGEAGLPAQKPDASRLVEALCILLCDRNPSPRKDKAGKTSSRWNLIIRDYRHIKDLLASCTVVDNTTIQLPELNATTLSQWYVFKSLRTMKPFPLQTVHQSLHTCPTPEPYPFPSTLGKKII